MEKIVQLSRPYKDVKSEKSQKINNFQLFEFHNLVIHKTHKLPCK